MTNAELNNLINEFVNSQDDLCLFNWFDTEKGFSKSILLEFVVFINDKRMKEHHKPSENIEPNY
jgi:hypothetical protein